MTQSYLPYPCREKCEIHRFPGLWRAPVWVNGRAGENNRPGCSHGLTYQYIWSRGLYALVNRVVAVFGVLLRGARRIQEPLITTTCCIFLGGGDTTNVHRIPGFWDESYNQTTGIIAESFMLVRVLSALSHNIQIRNLTEWPFLGYF